MNISLDKHIIQLKYDLATHARVASRADLQMGFYSKSCPKAEKIVQDYVNKHIPNAPSLPAALIRLHFHDCFLRGCDASILLNFTSSSGNQTEKFAIPNLTIRGFGFIDGVKSLLENECPGIVSCADVVTLVARDSIVATGGPSWKVPTGRRDGLISNGSETIGPIPAPFSNLSTLQTNFANQGLDLKDLVVLSGEYFSLSLIDKFDRVVDMLVEGDGMVTSFDENVIGFIVGIATEACRVVLSFTASIICFRKCWFS
ncbi:peroxidase 39-like [Apium graveolens]|uniref:peroxidase 39-like n=1 Tax=Apium graveolens TaxID=4045 RepID=UPI003D7B12A1